MALIACGECGRQVSSNAATCPQCGNPIADPVDAKAKGAPMTSNRVFAQDSIGVIRETSEKAIWEGEKKAWRAITGFLLAFFSIVWLFNYGSVEFQVG